MALKEIHLTMIHEALGIMGKEICSEIVQLHTKAVAYDKLITEGQGKPLGPTPGTIPSEKAAPKKNKKGR